MWLRHTSTRKFLWGGIPCVFWSSSALAAAPADGADVAARVEGVSVRAERAESALECPDSEWFQSRLTDQRGEAEQRGDFSVSLSHEGDKFVAKIQRWQDGARVGAERVLSDRSATCAPLAEAVAVTLAILAEDFARTQAAPEPVVAPPAAPKPTPPPVAPPAAEPPLRLWVGAGAGALGALISPVAPGFGVQLSLDSRSLRQGLRGTLTLPRRFDLGPGYVDVQAWLVTMLSCARLAQGDWGVAMCAAFDAGQMRGSAGGFADTQVGMRSYEALGLELQPSWNFASRGRISAVLGGMVPFTRESFSVTGLGTAYVPPAVSWRLLLFSELAVF